MALHFLQSDSSKTYLVDNITRILPYMGFVMESQEAIEFHFALFIGKTNDNIFKTMQNMLFSGLFCPIWAKINFQQKSGSITFSLLFESLVDAMHFYFETNILKDDNDSTIIILTAGRAKTSLYKECFAMFITYFSNQTQKLKTSFSGITRI